MKKIIVLILSLFILVSCTTDIEVEVPEKINNIEKNNSWIIEENQEIEETQKVNDFSSLEQNLELLKEINISEGDIITLNDIMYSVIVENITTEAIEKKDLNICSKLNGNFAIECKQTVIIKNSDIVTKSNWCEQLSDTGAITSCNNKFYKIKALENLDENLCDKILDDSVEKLDINSCRNEIFIEKAIKKLDYVICNKITNFDVRQMCKELVEGQIDIQ